MHQSRSFMTPAPHYDPQCSQIVGPYWEVAGSPRMFAAFSDPTVCRYSVPTIPPPPLAYSYEPVSLPLYQPAYQASLLCGPIFNMFILFCLNNNLVLIPNATPLAAPGAS